MKRMLFSRKAILQAIHAACVALFLLATQRAAMAQSFTAPFVVNGSSVSTNANGTFTSPVGFYDNVGTYSTISVNSGVTIIRPPAITPQSLVVVSRVSWQSLVLPPPRSQPGQLEPQYN
jgi:hypothetical protein